MKSEAKIVDKNIVLPIKKNSFCNHPFLSVYFILKKNRTDQAITRAMLGHSSCIIPLIMPCPTPHSWTPFTCLSMLQFGYKKGGELAEKKRKTKGKRGVYSKTGEITLGNMRKKILKLGGFLQTIQAEKREIHSREGDRSNL